MWLAAGKERNNAKQYTDTYISRGICKARIFCQHVDARVTG